MESSNYDLIVIGAGPAGESAAELASFGHRSLIIEKDRPGGTVTTTGGVPTKTLRDAAMAVSGFRDRDVYGVSMSTPPDIAVDIVRKRTWSVCEQLQQVTADNIAKNNVDYLRGNARLGSNRMIVVTEPNGHERTLTAKKVLLAVGSRPHRPESIPFDIVGVCDTDTILQRGRVPNDILIVGGGPVGVEFATICHALGAQVTIVNRGDRLLPTMDGEITAHLAKLFQKWGVSIVAGTTVQSVISNNEKLQVALSDGQIKFPDTVLFAGGRTPNTESLGLELAGIDLDERGRIAVDNNFLTSAEDIYAAGDVLGPTLASIAMEQGRAAVCHAFNIPNEGTVDPTPVSAVYGMPEISGAGLSEEECKKQGLDYEVGRSDFSQIPRGAISGRGGLLKLIFLKDTRKLVGVHCIGDIASELVGIGQMVIRCGATIDTIANMSMNTPTYSYAYKYATFDGLRRLAATRR